MACRRLIGCVDDDDAALNGDWLILIYNCPVGSRCCMILISMSSEFIVRHLSRRDAPAVAAVLLHLLG